MTEQISNPPIETQKEKPKPFNLGSEQKRSLSIKIGFLLVLLLLGSVYVYFNPSTNLIWGDSSKLYSFLNSNLNLTLTPVPNVVIQKINSTFLYNGAVYTYPDTNGSIILYFFGAEYSPYSATEGYAIASYLNKKLPDLSSNFYDSQYNLPAIPKETLNSISENGINIISLQAPLNVPFIANNTYNDSQQVINNWYDNLTVAQKNLFSPSYGIPQVYLLKTVGNTTYICNAYQLLPTLTTYNSTTSKTIFEGKVGVSEFPYMTVLPNPDAISMEASIINQCIVNMGK